MKLLTRMDTPVEQHLRTYCDVARHTYEEMCAVLLRRYGADREREFSRYSFQLNRQNNGESGEDFLDRLMRAHKIGWPEMKEREVLSTLMHGLLGTRLSNKLDIEYQKPMYQMRPPRMVEVRAYIQRLENSRELRRRKQEMGMFGTTLGQRAEQQPLKDYLNPAGMPKPDAHKQASPAQQGPYLPRREFECWTCGEKGHMAWQCTNNRAKKGPATTEDDPGAPFDELMMIENEEEEEVRISKPQSLVEVEYAGRVAWRDMKECATS